MKDLKRIGINMISGGAGYLIPMLVNIFSTPFVLNRLGAEAYGLLTLANVIIGYLIVADLGLDIPITQKIAEYYAKNDLGEKSKFLVATIKIYLVIGLTGMFFIFLFTNQFIALLAIPSTITQEAKIVFYLAGFGFFGSIINMWGKAVFNGLHRYEIANGINIFNNLFGILFGVVLINLGYGVIGFFIARIAGFFLSNFAYIAFVLKHIIRFNLFPVFDRQIWSKLKMQVGYGFVLRISGMIFSRMDQTLIGAWVTIAAVATYSIPILIATALSGLIASVTHFAFPMASAMSVTNSVKGMESFFIKITKFVVVLSTVSFIPFIVLGDKFLLLWINQELASESEVVLIMLLLAFYFNSSLSIGLNAFIVGIGQLKFFTFYSVTRGLVLFIGFLILIRFYGINGAGVSYLISLIVDLIFVFYSLRRKLNLSVLFLIKQSYLKPCILGFILGTGLYFLRNEINTWSTLFAAFAAFAVFYLVLILIFGVIDEKERAIVFTLIKRSRE